MDENTTSSSPDTVKRGKGKQIKLNDSDSPCKDCTARHLNCHSACQLYLDWRNAMWQKKNMLKDERRKDLIFRQHFIERSRKNRKKHRKVIQNNDY